MLEIVALPPIPPTPRRPLRTPPPSRSLQPALKPPPFSQIPLTLTPPTGPFWSLDGETSPTNAIYWTELQVCLDGMWVDSNCEQWVVSCGSPERFGNNIRWCRWRHDRTEIVFQVHLVFQFHSVPWLISRMTKNQGKKTHKHKQICGLSREWVGAKYLFMCFVGFIPYVGEKHINKCPQKSRDNPVKIMFMCFLLHVLFFRAQRRGVGFYWLVFGELH